MTKKCANGHTMDRLNIYVSPAGVEECRSCRADAGRRRHAKEKAKKMKLRSTNYLPTPRTEGGA